MSANLQFIRKSLLKQGSRPYLVLLQFLLGFVALTFAFSLTEGTHVYVEKITKVVDPSTVRVVSGTSSSQTSSEALQGFYREVQSNPYVRSSGTFLEEEIDIPEIQQNANLHKLLTQQNDSNGQQLRNPVLFVDSSFLQMHSFAVQSGRTLTSEDVKDTVQDTIPVLIGHQLANELPLGTKLTGWVPDDRRMAIVPKQYIVVGTLPPNTPYLKGGVSSLENALGESDLQIVAPMQIEQNYGNQLKERVTMNLLVQPKKVVDEITLVSQVSHLLSKHGLNGQVVTVEKQLNDLSAINRPYIIFCYSFSGLLLLLTSMGLLGILSANIVRRKEEFGIRYALGATPLELGYLVLGEALTLVLVASIGGFVVTLALRALLPSSFFTMSFSIVIVVKVMLIVVLVALVGSGLPMLRIVRMDPVTLIRGEES